MGLPIGQQNILDQLGLPVDLSGGEAVSIPFSLSIPFTNPQSDMGIYSMFQPTVFVANVIGATRNSGTLITVIADGVNAPTLSGMVAHTSDVGYVNTLGVVNTLNTWYDGLKYYYAWSQDAALSPVTGATALIMTGPMTGVIGHASLPFAISANGLILGSITITPSDGAAGGSFSPHTVTINHLAPAAQFTYTPISSGAKTISETNDGGLADASDITYTVPGVLATGITLSGPSSGAVGSASTNFTVGANGAVVSDILVTLNGASGGGTFSPTTVTLTPSSPIQTFQYTPAANGTSNIGCTNNAGLTNPPTVPYAASGGATAITLAGPTTGSTGAPSGNYTVAANGVITGNIQVTPNDSSGGGTFIPSTPLVINAGSPSATFTYTAASDGAHTIAETNNGGLSNASPITYTSSTSSQTVRLTTLTALTEFGSAPPPGWVYQGNAGSGTFNNQHGVATLSLPASTDGWFQAECEDLTAVAYSMIGFSLSATDDDYTNWLVQIARFDGTYQSYAGATAGATAVTPAIGDLYRVRREGSSIICEVSQDGGASYLNVHTYTSQSTAKLYLHATPYAHGFVHFLTGNGLS